MHSGGSGLGVLREAAPGGTHFSCERTLVVT